MIIARVLLLMAIAATAIAGLKITEKHDGWQLTAGAKVTGYTTYEECLSAIRVLGPGDYKCKDVTSIKAEFTCDDVPKPVMPTIVDADGFVVRPAIVVKPLTDKPDSEWGPTMEEGFVKGPGFPNCWVLGLVPYDAEFHAPDGPPDLSPSPFVYGVDPEWPIGGKCPSTDPKLCYVPPHPAIPPAP